MSATTATTERSCPFVGPRPFEFGEPLFGRDREVPKLLDLMIAERIVLMFSPSGAGKTSLIRAGLIPALREEGFLDLPIIRVKQPSRSEAGAAGASPINRFVRSTLESMERPRPGVDQAPPEHLASEGELTSAFRRWADDLGPPETGRRPNLVLIFDQFEEILTTDPADIAAKEAFFVQLGAALQDPGLWALFALREEYVAALEPYRNRIPRRLASRFRLDLLDAEDADEAFAKPFESQGITVKPKAVNKLVTDLRRVRVQRPDGTTEVVVGPYVEPVHLQIVGLRLWNRFAVESGFAQLDETHLSGSEGSVDAALAGYYADKVREIGATTGVGERAVREWCERQLLTDQGLRGQVLREPVQTRGLPEPVIEKLINAFLVRAEDRRGSTWYELAHDRLIEPIRQDNARWIQIYLQPWQASAMLWVKSERTDALLLRARDLWRALRWARERPGSELTQEERSYLKASRKMLIRRFGLAAVATSLLFAIISLAVVAWFGWNRAEDSTQTARLTLARLALQSGITSCHSGEVDRGMHWLTRGLKYAVATRSGDLEEASRSLLAAWKPFLHVLEARFRVEGIDEGGMVGFGPGGDTLVIASRLGVRRLAATTGQPLEPWIKLPDGQQIDCLSFSPDGRRVATGSADGTFRLRDADSWSASGLVLHHDDPGTETDARSGAPPVRRFTAAAFKADGQLLVTATNRSVRSWDLATGRQVSAPLVFSQPVNSIDISPGGRLALTGDRYTAQIWDLATGKAQGHPMRYLERDTEALPKRPILRHFQRIGVDQRTKAPDLYYGISKVAFNRDASMVATSNEFGAVRIWDLATGRAWGQVLPQSGSSLSGERMAFSPDGQALVIVGKDGESLRWRIAPGRRRRRRFQLDHPIWIAAFSRDGARALTVSDSGGVGSARVWDVGTGKALIAPIRHFGPARSVVLSPDGRTLLIGQPDGGKPCLWDVDQDHPRGRPLPTDGKVIVAAFSPDSRMVVTGADDIRVWDSATGLEKSPSVGGTGRGGVVAAMFSPDGKAVIAGADRIRCWTLDGVALGGMPIQHEGLWTATLSRDGRTLLTAGEDGLARLWDLRSGRSKGTPLEYPGLGWVQFSPDGLSVVTGCRNEMARLWNANTGGPRGAPLVTQGVVWSTAFRGDGKMVATGSSVGIVQMWDTATATAYPTGPPILHNGLVASLAFSPDGRTLLTGSEDRTADLWEVPTSVRGEVERIELWIQAITSIGMGDDESFRVLDSQTWRSICRRLVSSGGAPE